MDQFLMAATDELDIPNGEEATRVWNEYAFEIESVHEFLDKEYVFVGIDDEKMSSEGYVEYCCDAFLSVLPRCMSRCCRSRVVRYTNSKSKSKRRHPKYTKFWQDPDFDISRSHLTKLFRLFDHDGSGVITYEDFRIGLRAVGLEVTNEDFDHLTGKLDVDNSGDIQVRSGFYFILFSFNPRWIVVVCFYIELVYMYIYNMSTFFLHCSLTPHPQLHFHQLGEFIHAIQDLTLRARFYSEGFSQKKEVIECFCYDYSPDLFYYRCTPAGGHAKALNRMFLCWCRHIFALEFFPSRSVHLYSPQSPANNIARLVCPSPLSLSPSLLSLPCPTSRSRVWCACVLLSTNLLPSVKEFLFEPPGPAPGAAVRWINVTGLHPETLFSLARVYKLHQLEVEDAMNSEERVRYEKHHDGHIQIIVKVRPLGFC